MTQSKVLVCGSIAIDVIGRYRGSFAEYQQAFPIEALNVSLQLGSLQTSFGGCGMNISYGLSRLQIDCIPLTAAGLDYLDHYQAHLEAIGIDTRYIAVDEEMPSCACALVISDDHGNQFTAFHAGAAVSSRRKLPSEIAEISAVQLAVLAPEDAPIMLRQARDLQAFNIPLMFDPGQGLAGFTAQEAIELIALCQYTIVNEHELRVLCRLTGLSENALEAQMQQVIVTRGADGVEIREADGRVMVPAVDVTDAVDATGCGDAFRAGYVYGLTHKADALTCGRFGNLVAAANLRCRETQAYDLSPQALHQEYNAVYGTDPGFAARKE